MRPNHAATAAQVLIASSIATDRVGARRVRESIYRTACVLSAVVCAVCLLLSAVLPTSVRLVLDLVDALLS